MTTAFISVQGLTRRFPDVSGRGELTVFEDLWFNVAEGEFACIIGHSGCGKSTILNILAGLDAPTDGHIIAAGKHVEGPSLDRAVIFQGHALMPWLSALGNVELAVSSRNRDWTRDQVREHAMKYLALVHLDGSEAKKPAQLSGGMKQRVGIARALAIQPRMLLMDEPFSALDALTRGALQDEIIAIRSATRKTVFMITHDVDEALLLADKILLVICGEMGRTPKLSELAGRNHWGNLGPLVLAGGGLPMGQVLGRSTTNGGEPADNPVTRRHLIGTIMHTLFDVAALRLRPDAIGAVARVITESEPIKGLIA